MFDYKDYSEMLSYIDPITTTRDEWIHVGMALKTELGDPGLDLWDTWSARDPDRYKTGECSKIWKSFKRGGITGATIHKMAKAGGYQKFKIDMNGIDRPDKMTWEEFENDLVLTDNGIERETKKPTEKPAQNKKPITNNITANSEEDSKYSQLIKALTDQEGIFSEFIQQAQVNLFNSIKANEYIAERGLNADACARFRIGYVQNYKYEYKKDGKEKSLLVKEALVIPGSLYGYGIRNMTKDTTEKNKYLKPSNDIYPESIDIPIGLLQVIKEPNKRDPVTGYLEPIFICEGYLDAPSFYLAGADAISLNGGNSNIGRILKAFSYFNVNRPVILALDNDKTGLKNQPALYETLHKKGVDTYQVDPRSLYGEYKDANECITEDLDNFKQRVKEALSIPRLEFEAKFNKNQIESFKKYLDTSLNHPPLPTGFPLLDNKEHLDGGLYPGLYTMGALSSAGKTTFMLQIADNIAKEGYPVLYISLEMLSHELRAKSISRYTYEGTIERNISESHAKTVRGILDKRRYADYSEDDLEILEEAGDAYFSDTGDNLVILERRDKNVTVDSIERDIAEFKRQTGRTPVIFIDYLQILDKPEKFEDKNITDKQIIDENVKALKRLAVDFNIPVFNISSLNRNSYSKSVDMDSFKESGAIEYSSDVLIALEPAYIITDDNFKNRTPSEKNALIKEAKDREKKRLEDKQQRLMDLTVLKNRNGKRDYTIKYLYSVKFNHYHEFTKQEWQREKQKEKKIRESLRKAHKEIDDKIKKSKKKSAIPNGLLE